MSAAATAAPMAAPGVAARNEVSVHGTEEPMPVVRAGLLPHQDFRAVLGAAPYPPPRLSRPAASRLPLPGWPGVAPDVAAAAPAVTLAAIRRAPPSVMSPRQAGAATGSVCPVAVITAERRNSAPDESVRAQTDLLAWDGASRRPDSVDGRPPMAAVASAPLRTLPPSGLQDPGGPTGYRGPIPGSGGRRAGVRPGPRPGPGESCRRGGGSRSCPGSGPGASRRCGR